jgi:hypothetical protein
MKHKEKPTRVNLNKETIFERVELQVKTKYNVKMKNVLLTELYICAVRCLYLTESRRNVNMTESILRFNNLFFMSVSILLI